MKQFSFEKVVASDVLRAILLIWFLAALPSSAQSGGDYELTWSTIDGGGGTSSGGPYVLTGTMSQPEAGAMSGGEYEILAGFWPGPPLCTVEFDDFAKFAGLWLTGDLAGDLDGDSNVDFGDLSWFADYWLCYCPTDWPLK